MLVLEVVILQQQQQGLEDRNGQHAVGQDRQQDMREYARLLSNRRCSAGWGELGEEYRQAAQWKEQQQQVFHWHPMQRQ